MWFSKTNTSETVLTEFKILEKNKKRNRTYRGPISIVTGALLCTPETLAMVSILTSVRLGGVRWVAFCVVLSQCHRVVLHSIRWSFGSVKQIVRFDVRCCSPLSSYHHPSSAYGGRTFVLHSVNIDKCIRGKLHFDFGHSGKTVGFWNTLYGIQRCLFKARQTSAPPSTTTSAGKCIKLIESGRDRASR